MANPPFSWLSDVRAGGDRCDRSTMSMRSPLAPRLIFDFNTPAQRSVIFGGIYRQRNLTERLPEINVKQQNLLGGMMHCSHLTSFAVPGTAMGQPYNGKPYFAEATPFRGKDVTRLEIQEAPIICGQQGAKRHRDENIVPTPRQVVTRCIGGLFSADIAVQHRAGNRWQWHRKKSNRSATVRTEESAAKRPA